MSAPSPAVPPVSAVAVPDVSLPFFCQLHTTQVRSTFALEPFTYPKAVIATARKYIVNVKACENKVSDATTD